MNFGTVLVLFAVCIVLALLVSLPFMVIARRRRRKLRGSIYIAGRKEIPTHELPGLAAGVCVMFLGFAQAYMAPDTWFGEQMSTNSGRVSFCVVIYLAYAAGMAIVRRITPRRGSG